MLVAYAIVIVFVLYAIVQFAPTRSRFVVEVAHAQSATVTQAILANQANVDAATAAVTSGHATATAAAQSSNIHTLTATQADANGSADGRLAAAADKVVRDAEKEKRKAAQIDARAKVEQLRLDQKKMIETAKLQRLEVVRPSIADLARISSLDPDERAVERQLAETQQSLIQDQISVKQADIAVLKAQLVALDDTVDTAEPPSLGKRFGRLFR